MGKVPQESQLGRDWSLNGHTEASTCIQFLEPPNCLQHPVQDASLKRQSSHPGAGGSILHPGLPGAPLDEAGLTRKFETSHVGGVCPNVHRSTVYNSQDMEAT